MAEQRKSGGSGGSSHSGGGSGSSSSRSGSGSGSSSSRSRSSSGGSKSKSKGSRQSGNGGAPKQSSASRSRATQSSEQSGGQSGASEPDVLLDVPQLKVEEVGLEVDNLHARIALETRLGDMLQLYVGADIVADHVALELKGVDAQAQLTARLQNVFSILDRTLQTVDANPEILTELAQSSSQAALESGDEDKES